MHGFHARYFITLFTVNSEAIVIGRYQSDGATAVAKRKDSRGFFQVHFRAHLYPRWYPANARMYQLRVGNQDQVKAKGVVYLVGKQARTLPVQNLVVGMIDVHDVRAHAVSSFERLNTSENVI